MSDTMSGETVLAKVDTRPFFERVMTHGLNTGQIDAARLEGLKREGAKAIVQLATYFGTPNLRPELEAAKLRLVTLVSLALEADAGGSLEAAVGLLNTKSLLALSKAGADRLRALLKLPDHDILEPPTASLEHERAELARWTFDEPITYARYLAERRSRENRQALHDMSYWLGQKFGVSPQTLQEFHISPESLINSVLLVLFADKTPKRLFSAQGFKQLHATACKKRTRGFALLKYWEEETTPIIRRQLDRAREHFLDTVLPVLKRHAASEILGEQDRFSGLFYFAASDINELTHHDVAREKEWRRITAGKGDHTDVQCTLLLLVATGLPPAASLRKKDAIEIWRRFKDQGFDEKAVTHFIQDLTPFEYQSDIRRLWDEDLSDDARMHLDNDDQARVLAYLHDCCRSSWKKS